MMLESYSNSDINSNISPPHTKSNPDTRWGGLQFTSILALFIKILCQTLQVKGSGLQDCLLPHPFRCQLQVQAVSWACNQTGMEWIRFCRLGNSKGLGSSVPGTDQKPNRLFLITNHNITGTMLLSASHTPGSTVLCPHM